jgi:putative redox protein
MGQRRRRADRERRFGLTDPATVRVEWSGDHRFSAGKPGRPPIVIDGDGQAGPSPVDTLLASLATCVSVDVADILAKRRTPASSLVIDAVGQRVDTIPRRLEHVMLNFSIAGGGIERVHAERAVELAVTKYCSVRDSLRPDVPVEWTIHLSGE